MLVKTKYFGEVDLPEEKIVTLEKGLIGFQDYKRFTILYDSEKEESNIAWFQSIEEQTLALPIIDPAIIMDEYNPQVEEELLKDLGDLTDENLVVFLAMTVPADLKQMSVNLMAPIILNADSRKGVQVIVENPEYEIKYKIYDILQARSEKE